LVFTSLQFWGFFALVWLLVVVVLGASGQRLLPEIVRRHALGIRNAVLLLASYVFYGAWDVRFLGLLCFTTLVDYGVGLWMSRQPRERRGRILLLSLGANLGCLGFFKYYDFFATSAADLLHSLGVDLSPLVLGVTLPVGISFYTFQSLSYTINVYRGEAPEPSLLKFATFIAFFPQLVAGPIERSQQLLPQFHEVQPATWDKLWSGVHLAAAGVFKKVVIADNVAKVANAAFALERPNMATVLIGAYAFAFQIYCDFSGYSDIARGVARLMGFELSRNFDLPYFAARPSEFWRRWHISLSTWLRDYLYISLGGNRRGSLQTYRNLMITMLLGGLWHGAAWTFVVWGAIHGALLCLYRAVEEPVVGVWPKGALASQIGRALAVVLFFHLTCLAWVFFRAESMTQALDLLRALGTLPRSMAEAIGKLGPVRAGGLLVSLLLLIQLVEWKTRDHWVLLRVPAPLRGLVYTAGALLFIWLGDDGGNAFIYFQF
jgi:alginate O-acetyltransferase complex protein AlgI